MAPKPSPVRCLQVAAILFAVEIEAEDEGYGGADWGSGYAGRRKAWDRLRRAALRYRDAPRRNGRPKRVP